MPFTEETPFAAELGDQPRFKMRFPTSEDTLDQDEEWCEVEMDGKWRRFRFHDYNEIYGIPGLYESLFYRTLRCSSPLRVTELLADVARDYATPMEKLRVLDVGAGNGMVAAALQDAGVGASVGVDIIPEAKKAADRDRPWVYDKYHVCDLTDLPEKVEKSIRSDKLNCLASVAALGYGDLPSPAFLTALDLIETPGFLAFNIKEDFLHDGDDTGFSGLIRQLNREQVIQIQAYRRYRHRLSLKGEPLFYVAMVAIKQRDVPDHLRD